MIRIPLAARALPVVLVLAIAGCASAPASKQLAPEEIVAERAQQRWDALMGGRWDEAYGMLTRGYRDAHNLDSYRANFLGGLVNWKAVRVVRVTCDSPERCIATLDVDYELKGGMPGVPRLETTQQLEETWLDVGEGWLHLPRR